MLLHVFQILKTYNNSAGKTLKWQLLLLFYYYENVDD